MANNDFISLKKIVDGCKKGREDQQKILFEKYYGLFMSICLRYTNSEHEAKDLIHEGFIKIFTKIKEYNGEGSFEGWMKRIIVNNAIDYCRKKSSSKEMLVHDTVQFENQSEEEEDSSYIKGIEQSEILRAVQGLSESYRAVFNLYVMEEYSHKEIAEKLGISVGASKSNLAKAKRNLRKALQNLIDKRYVC